MGSRELLVISLAWLATLVVNQAWDLLVLLLLLSGGGSLIITRIIIEITQL